MLYRNFSTQEAIDQQYDPMRTADGTAVIQAYRNDSDAARASLDVVQDLAYGPTIAETLDLFPAETPDAPLHVFFHGGYWRALSSKEFAFVARQLVPEGVSVAVVNYALCPQVTIGEIVRQCRAAIAWLYRHGGHYGYDPERITISGHSAGGHIVGMMLATDWPGQYGLPRTLIKGASAISGLFDLAPFPYSWLQPKLQLSWAEVALYSPVRHSPEVECPVVLAVGELETPEFHRQLADYSDWLSRCHPGRPIEVVTIPEANHFTALDGFKLGRGSLFEAIRTQALAPKL